MADDRVYRLVLTLKLRPKKLDNLVDREKIVAELRSRFASGRIPRCLMFHGAGAGKTSIAFILRL